MLTRSESQIIFKKHEEIFGRNFEEPMRRVPDLTKISSTIGWQAKKNLDQIIEEVVNYYRHK
jgi:UDP-glucose 4-epimerase